MVMQLTKKPIAVTGVRWTGNNQDELESFAGDDLYFNDEGTPVIRTLEGDMKASDNAVLVKGVKGEFYFVKDGIFQETFDVASEEAHWDAEAREEASDASWAVPKKKKLRIDDAKHVRLAWSQVDRTGGLSSAEKAQARKRILAKAKALKIDTSGWNTSTEALEEPQGEPQYVPMDQISYLFLNLIEELGEASKVASKVIRFGLDSNKEGEPPNRYCLSYELADVFGCMELINGELESQGIAPIPYRTGDALINAAVQKRMTSLKKEFQAGRFVLPEA